MNADESLHSWLVEKGSAAIPPLQLSVVIPAYNEERRLPSTLISLIDYLEREQFTYEVLIVDDGSKDGTSEMVRKFERIRPNVHLLRMPKNYGKGHAVRTGCLSARGSIVLFLDADGATPIEELPGLLLALKNGAGIAIGSRAKPNEEKTVRTIFIRRILGRSFHAFVHTLVLPGIYDSQCGFKALRQDVARFVFERQNPNGFSFDVEILYIAQRAGLRIDEIPVNWINVPGSKVNLVTDSFAMFCDLFRFRLQHRSIRPEDYQKSHTEVS